MIDILISLLSIIFIISIPVFLHELGHFIAARSVGIKVEKFYVGMNFFGLGIKKKINDTEYGIGLFPLGGYVKVAGIIDESLDSSNSDKIEDYEFRSKNTFQKLWFLSAGVLMNFLLSIIIFTGIFYVKGVYDIIDEPIIAGIQDNIRTLDMNDAIPIISPASKLGLQVNDEILEINDNQINSWMDIGNQIAPIPNQMIQIKWLRNDIIFIDSVRVESSKFLDRWELSERGVLGIRGQTKHIDLGFFESVSLSCKRTFQFIQDTFYSIIGLITGNISAKYMMGIVGIANEAGNVAKNMGFSSLLIFMAYISSNLGLINILPIPGLDGGHAFIAIIEGMIRKELSSKVKYTIQFIGLILILSLFIFTIFNDIKNIFN